MPRLTMCLIARDEEWMLPECLASVRGIVDEIVVVDTGSVDGTRAIATAAGARVVDHPWQDDFAAARNAALPHATGDWILMLDADERLGPGAAHALRKAMRDRHTDCFLLPLHNATRLDAPFAEVLDGRARRGEPGWLPRLLRRTPDLAWEGVIHESVGGWLTRGRRKTGRCAAPIVHLGAVPELRAALAKDARNLRLLERRCALEPTSPVARAYLARELIRVGELPRADRELERAWADLRDAVAAGEAPARVQLASIRAHRLLERDEPDAVLGMMAELRAAGAFDHPNLPLLCGIAWSRKACVDGVGWPEAEANFRAALAAPKAGWSEEVLPGATGWQSATRLAITLLAQGRPAEAVPLLGAALAENPGDVDAQLALAEAQVHLDPRRALSLAEPLLPRGAADAWLVAADACEALGASRERAAFLDRALALPLQAPHRRARLEAARTLLPLAERLAAHTPRPPPPGASVDGLLRRAAAAAEEGDAGAAFGAWLGVLRLAPRTPAAWTGLATALHVLGAPEAAVAVLAGARGLAPHDPELLALSAELLSLAGDHGEATRLARRLAAEVPDHPVVAAVREAAGLAAPPAPDPATLPDVTVLITGAAAGLDDLLDHLALQDLPPTRFEVLLALDTPVTPPSPRPFVVRTVGAGPDARVTALAEARGAVLVRYSSGTLPAPDALRRHLAAHEASAAPCACLGPVVPHPELGGVPLLALLHTSGAFAGPTPDQAARGEGLKVTNLSLRTAVLRAAGGFDPTFDVAEGAELGRRLLAAGVSLRPDPTLGATRTNSPSLADWLATEERRGVESVRLQDRHRDTLPTDRDPHDPAVRFPLRARIEEALPAQEKLALSVAGALSRGVPPGREDRQRLAAALAGLAAHHRERGFLAGLEGWTRPVGPRPARRRSTTSVIIPNLNGFPHVEGCLGTLRATTTHPLEVVFVDNGSTDGSLEWLRRQPDVRVLEMGRNLGAPAARNRGLAVATGDRILFCDNDVLFTPRWHEILSGHLDAWPDIGMVGPVSDYVVDAQKAARPPREGESLDAYAAAIHLENRGRHTYTSQLILFFILADREMVERIGGIDEGFGRWGFEDNDWALRASHAGYQLRIARDCFIRHLGSRTATSAKIDYNHLLLENWGVFKRKWGLDPALPYGSRLDLNPILARGFDPARHFVPFR